MLDPDEILPNLGLQMQAQYPDRGSSRLRKGRFSAQGSYYFVTTRTDHNQRFFTDPACVRVLFDCLDRLESRGYIDLLFGIAMPDHIHLLFRLAGDRTLPQVMRSLKGYSGRRIASANGTTGPIWQKQYYEHMIRTNESLTDVVSYCWHNPVRSGLATNPADYPHRTGRLQPEE